MRPSKISLGLIGIAALLASPAFAAKPAPAAAPPEQGSINDFFSKGKITGQLRYRYEHVDQNGPAPITKDADAHTMRANLGLLSGEYQNLQAFVEMQVVQDLGLGSFNNSVNGQTKYPVVADANDIALNQAWGKWTGVKGLELKVGRQAINIDNQRFIGSVDWRQNDQTFDSVLASFTGIDKTTLQYGFAWNVNRVFGQDNPLGVVDTATHILRANYKYADWLNATAYGYLIDIDKMASSSSQTYGLRATGETPVMDKLNFVYEAEYAHQSDYANNPAAYGANYFFVSPGVKAYGVTAKAGYELLGGNGTSSFQTPLATLHRFNGWADKFLTTPTKGLQDVYASLGYQVGGLGNALDGTELAAVYHNYKGDSSGDFGSEWNLSAAKTFKLPKEYYADSLNVTVKYADYNAADAPFTDTQKFWFQTGLSF